MTTPAKTTNLSGSYVSNEGLRDEEVTGYKSAGILPWREEGGVFQILVGVEKEEPKKIVIFGGKREASDATPMDTAARTFNDETNKCAEAAIGDVRGALDAVMWICGGKHALYPLDISRLGAHAANIAALPVALAASVEVVNQPKTTAAHWLPLPVTQSEATPPLGRFLQHILADPAFRQWSTTPSFPIPAAFNYQNCLSCKFWNKGTCTKGTSCPFIHIGQQKKAPRCHFYASKRCTKGATCPFTH